MIVEEEKKYFFILNHGPDEGFEKYTLSKDEFIRMIAEYITEPKKVFLGLGDFLEIRLNRLPEKNVIFFHYLSVP